MNASSFPPCTEAPTASPFVSVVEITDPTKVAGSIEVIEQDVMQLESKALRARRIVVRLGASMVMFHSTNLPVRACTRLEEGFVAYVAFGARAAGTLNGIQIGPDRLLASMPGHEVEFIVAAGYESVCFLVLPDVIRTHFRGRRRRVEDCLPRGIEMLSSTPAAARRLYRWGRRLTCLAAKQPQLFDVPETRVSAEVELLETLFGCLASAAQVEPTLKDLTRQGHSRIVRLAENYAMSHIADRLHVTDLCEAAGVSERTLQYAFKELSGMTPMAI